MHIHFYKYQGTGNDFVILDNRDGRYNAITCKQVNRLCDRRFGIGADGLMMLNKHADYDFEMKYYNADGKVGTMCGNGGRSMVMFANDIGIIKDKYKFLACDGEHKAHINTDGTVALRIKDVSEMEYDHGNYILNTGSPHFINLVRDVMHLDVFKKGREIRYSAPYKDEGINVNFVEQTDEPDKIIVRTYERGVEDETYSCGTGVTASALVCSHNDNGFNRVEVKTKGGDLSVEFDKNEDSYKNIWLIGPAAKVFEGDVEVED